jgi:hypothetical protein
LENLGGMRQRGHDRVRGARLTGFLGPDEAVSGTRDSLLRPALVSVRSVEPASAVAARFRRRRSCGKKFGRLRGQAHGGQDLLDGVVGLDEGDEAEGAFAGRAGRVDRERPPEQLAPRNIVRERQGSRGLVFLLRRRLGHGGRHALAAEAAVGRQYAKVAREMPPWGWDQRRQPGNEGQWSQFHRRGAIGPRTRVGSRRALLAAYHRGRVWEPFEGSHHDDHPASRDCHPGS